MKDLLTVYIPTRTEPWNIQLPNPENPSNAQARGIIEIFESTPASVQEKNQPTLGFVESVLINSAEDVWGNDVP